MKYTQILCKYGLAFTTVIALGCTHPIEVGGNGEGDILASSHSDGCTYEEGSCNVIVAGAYEENYVALPRAGSTFSHWEGCDYAGLETFIRSGGGNICSVLVSTEWVEAAWGQTVDPSRAVFQPLLESPTAPPEPFNYANVQLPDHYLNNGFPPQVTFQTAAVEHDSTPLDNPTTDAGAALGRVLFYDRKLSASGNTACASCHRQKFGFDDPTRFSVGHAGGTTRRAAMTLTNAVFNTRGRYFWDERAATLEDQVLMPFQDAVEMGLTLNQLVDIVAAQPYYTQLFIDAFGDAAVTSDRISKALAQFVRSLVSFNAKYDHGRAQVNSPLFPFPNFTDAENRGKDIFNLPGANGINCGGCHATEAFVNVIPNFPVPAFITHGINNGLDATSTTDLGIEESSGLAFDRGKFRIPSLRNVGVSAPHTHDGRFANLGEVVDFYSTGIQNHPNITDALQDGQGGVRHFNFTEDQKSDLIAFLHTLTDYQFLEDDKFSDPFAPASPMPGATEKVTGFIRLVDALDDPAHYCIDVPGVPGNDLNIDSILWAHSCKIGDEELTEDQVFQFGYRSRQAHLQGYDRCLVADDRAVGATLRVEDCEDPTMQVFGFNEQGQLQALIAGDTELCVAVAPGPGIVLNELGHMARQLSLQPCDEVDLSRSRWEMADAVKSPESNLVLWSPGIRNDEPFPTENTRCEDDFSNCWPSCGGANISPALSWDRAPQGTQAFALLLDDADPFPHLHWVVYGMDASTTSLPENVAASENVVFGATGINNNDIGYLGSCPPAGGGNHTYVFTLYALSEQLELSEGATAAQVQTAMEGKILGTATLSATYESRD